MFVRKFVVFVSSVCVGIYVQSTGSAKHLQEQYSQRSGHYNRDNHQGAWITSPGGGWCLHSWCVVPGRPGRMQSLFTTGGVSDHKESSFLPREFTGVLLVQSVFLQPPATVTGIRHFVNYTRPSENNRQHPQMDLPSLLEILIMLISRLSYQSWIWYWPHTKVPTKPPTSVYLTTSPLC